MAEMSGADALHAFGVEPDGTVRDRSTGYGLFYLPYLNGWQVVGTSLARTNTSSRPYVPQIELRDSGGGIINMRMGDAGARRSAGMDALMLMYGTQTIGVDTTNYADVPDPIAVADNAAAQIASGMGASGVRFIKQYAFNDIDAINQAAFERTKQANSIGGFSLLHHPFLALVLRVYEFEVAGEAWKMATYVRLEASKEGTGLGEGALDGLGDAVGNAVSNITGALGGMVDNLMGHRNEGTQVATQDAMTPQGAPAAPQNAGTTAQDASQGGFMEFFMGGGLIGKMMRDQQAAAAAQNAAVPEAVASTPAAPVSGAPAAPAAAAAPASAAAASPSPEAAPTPAPTTGPAWCTEDYAAYVKGGTIYWSLATLANFVAPASDFDAQFTTAFIPLVTKADVHQDVLSLSAQVTQQEAMMIQQRTNMQLAQNQAAFQAQQAAHRQVQASYDSYNQAWQARSDAHHAAFRAATNAQFNTPAPGAAPADYAEAIRGVNTYTTSDGREVEVSTHADHVWENQAGDVIGTSGTESPGTDWTELPPN